MMHGEVPGALSIAGGAAGAWGRGLRGDEAALAVPVDLRRGESARNDRYAARPSRPIRISGGCTCHRSSGRSLCRDHPCGRTGASGPNCSRDCVGRSRTSTATSRHVNRVEGRNPMTSSHPKLALTTAAMLA
ncbi:MAG: hypothetical protein IH810_03890, partial [Proteobacteria bacterium]|nr:hypothetical protein [Pseudomonadota bacterium]